MQSPSFLSLHAAKRPFQPYKVYRKAYKGDYSRSRLDQVLVSMSRNGECWDNAPNEVTEGIDSFWATLKRECATTLFDTRSQAQAAIFEYVMVFYNRTRRNSRLGYLSPAAFEAQFQRQLLCS